ncbi:olfactory receptor 56A4-like [Rhinoderma darwinii]|uniref:olfactory receptor 56A4-like n=1 Tax=Rhinoderma darwinii TaxID=43563 RepID=UPI003F67A2DC
MARLSTATGHKVDILHQQGLSQAKISQQTVVSQCSIPALLKKQKETGNIEDCRHSGQPKKQYSRLKTHHGYFPSTSDDVQQCYQLRTVRNQLDPGSTLLVNTTDPHGANISTLEFIFICFPEIHSWDISGLLLFFLLVALLSNAALIVVIVFEPRLHHPMYYFLAMLSVVDLFLSTVATPKILYMLWTGSTTVTATACFSQMFFTIMWSATESSIFLVMAYDRYVAICNPLHYSSIITKQFVAKACVFILLRNMAVALPMPLLAVSLDYCSSREILHCFCENMSVEKLSCSDNTSSSIYGLVIFIVVGGTDVLLIIISYSVILRTVVVARSFSAASKAFRTCGSHLIVICMFYITIATTMVSNRAVKEIPRPVHVVLSLLHHLLSPALNPVVYGVMTKEIRHAIQRILGKIKIHP